MNRLDFNQGLRAATNYLIKTAEDLEQRLPEREIANANAKVLNRLGWQVEARSINEDRKQAALLRGQAHNILDTLTK